LEMNYYSLTQWDEQIDFLAYCNHASSDNHWTHQKSMGSIG
jgi:hypothetical protein